MPRQSAAIASDPLIRFAVLFHPPRFYLPILTESFEKPVARPPHPCSFQQDLHERGAHATFFVALNPTRLRTRIRPLPRIEEMRSRSSGKFDPARTRLGGLGGEGFSGSRLRRRLFLCCNSSASYRARTGQSGVFPEHLVEIPHAEEQYVTRVLGFELLILPHRR